jgi:hypothetical protein
MTSIEEPAWVPEACALPTTERPLRLAEFDDLVGTALRGQHRLSSTALRWDLDPAAEAAVRDLTTRESSCCSFFTFTLQSGDAALRLDIEVPAAYAEVLDALAQRARTGIRP